MFTKPQKLEYEITNCANMHKKNTIIGIVLSIVIIFLVFWSLDVDVSTVPVATIRSVSMSPLLKVVVSNEKYICIMNCFFNCLDDGFIKILIPREDFWEDGSRGIFEKKMFQLLKI